MTTLRIAGLLAFVSIAFELLACEPSAYRLAETSGKTATVAPARRPAHCRDVPTSVPCRPADTGR
jgi:hypothetical protein